MSNNRTVRPTHRPKNNKTCRTRNDRNTLKYINAWHKNAIQSSAQLISNFQITESKKKRKETKRNETIPTRTQKYSAHIYVVCCLDWALLTENIFQQTSCEGYSVVFFFCYCVILFVTEITVVFAIAFFSLHFFFTGGLPRAWSTPSLSPFVRAGLKPPLLQQAAFDDLIFKVDVMRNVASRHTQKEDDVEGEELEDKELSHKWCSLPIINMPDKEEHKSNGEEVHNEDEGLQEVSAI